MLGHIVYKAYYGSFKDYYSTPNRAVLFYSSLTNNVDSVKALNEPILDWEVSRAGSIVFKLPPCNAGYSAILCKIMEIFIERNGVLIWHGRAISDVFDDELNREITCEGALNYLLDTHVKPNDITRLARFSELFNDLINSHNRSLEGGDSAVFDKLGWKKFENNGTIEIDEYGVTFKANGNTGWGFAVWSDPSMWRYKDYAGKSIRVKFKAKAYGSNSFTLAYGLLLRETQWVIDGNRIAYKEEHTSHADYEEFVLNTYLGPNGLDGTGHEDAYIGFYVYLNTSSNLVVTVSDITVEFYHDYQMALDKSFPVEEGKRTGVRRVPYGEEAPRSVSITDYASTLDVLNSIFIEQYGGYLYVDYAKDEGFLSYHPVLNYIYGDATEDAIEGDLPEIRYGKNLISLKETTDYTDYPTILIPLGRQKEDWEKAIPAANVTYNANKYIDKDGHVQNTSDGTYYIAQVDVEPYDIYYVYGQGVDDQGLYSIIDGSNNILDQYTFSNRDGNWYQHVEIVIPPSAKKLRVFFKNSSQSSTITGSIFKIQKFNYNDPEEYITLEGYNVVTVNGQEIVRRTDELAGTKFYPVVDMAHVYTYGWIEKVVQFDEAEDQETLLSMAIKYCRNLAEASKTYEVEAAELAPIVGSSDYIPIGMPGSYARTVVPQLGIDKALCVTKVNLNLRNFAKSTYSLANLPPPDLADLIAKGLY